MASGSAATCAACAARTLTPVAVRHCKTCSQQLPADGTSTCSNRICGYPWPAMRGFSRVDAIAMYTAPLSQAIQALKYEGRTGWATIFGRLVVGWLNLHPGRSAGVTHIMGNPSEPDRQPLQHIEAIMAAAWAEDVTQSWPLPHPDEPMLTKLRPTASSAGGGRAAKQSAAREHAQALRLSGSIDGATILLIDDVFTTGSQFHEVGRFLIGHGAVDVRGLVLARVPWRD
ncbi:hypothetical protein [Nonomuraea sp. NPDC050310]|uniref:ComF family protein n=1 Tax=Nonomuraea sp. NPDC050310 TaxID=3154935 RepID=UPI0033DA5A1D